MKEQKPLISQSNFLQNRTNKFHAARATPAPLDVMTVFLTARHHRHNAGTGFKGPQNMLGLQSPGAWNQNLPNLSLPAEVGNGGTGPIH
jgi:hypothetical protein